jgi:hypothetical protein
LAARRLAWRSAASATLSRKRWTTCASSSDERSVRAVEDEPLLARIRVLHAANYYAYGYRRTLKALQRAVEDVGRDRVKRLMRAQAEG